MVCNEELRLYETQENLVANSTGECCYCVDFGNHIGASPHQVSYWFIARMESYIVRILLTAVMMFLGVPAAMGDVIYYKAATGEIVEAFKEPVPVHDGFAQVIVTNADSIIWPVPSGCTVGKLKWSRIVLPITDPPVFMLNPALKFFRCQLVSSATDVDLVSEKEVTNLAGPSVQQMLKQTRQAIKLLDLLTVECPSGSTTTNCDTKRMKALNDRATMLSLYSQIEQIYQDATTFKAAQGW